MCFICEQVTVESSYAEQRTNFQSKITTGMPSKTAIMTADWLPPLVRDYESNDNSELEKPEDTQEETHNTDIWYDAIDDITLLNMKNKDFNLWPLVQESHPQMSAMEDNNDNLIFYDAVDNFTQMDMENNSNCVSEAHASDMNDKQSASGTKATACGMDNSQNNTTDIEWDDGFEFYLWSHGECDDSDSECESGDEECEDELDSNDKSDDDNDFIIFEEPERTVNFSTCCPKSSYKCTEKKPKKHVHFSPELVTVYVVTWGEEESRKGPWIQFAVDRMHFHHRIAQLEQILTPCLLLKQKLGYQFIESMNYSTNQMKQMAAA